MTKPTTICESCGEGWHDSDLAEKFNECTTLNEINEVVDGEECPHCGHEQDALK